jgi:hypothetical protein
MLNEILQFIWSVFDHWALLMGGVIMTTIAFWHTLKDKPVKKNLTAGLASIFFATAFFQTWSDQKALKEKAESDNIQLTMELKEKDALIQSNVIAFEHELSANEDAIAHRYDDKFERMKKYRYKAATELLKHLKKGDMGSLTDAPELDEVLGLFDDLGHSWKMKDVSDEILYQYFYDYIRTYYQPAEIYITNTERNDPTAFENIKPLLDRLTQIYAEKSKVTLQQSIWSRDDEVTALKDEIELTK